MSKFVAVEWFGREDKIGIVLTYDEFDGFKARMAPLPKYGGQYANSVAAEQLDIKYLMEQAAKIPFEWAWGIFKQHMMLKWRSLKDFMYDDEIESIRYDGKEYNTHNLEAI